MKLPRIGDSIVNFVTGLGLFSRDKTVGAKYGAIVQMSPQELLDGYRGDWIAKKVVDIPATDATREWRAWRGADAAEIQALEAEEQRLGVKQKVRAALTRSRLYGGGAIMIGVAGQNPETPFDPNSVPKGGLSYLPVFSRHELSADTTLPVADLESPYYGLPEHFVVQGAGGVRARIHISRLVMFRGEEIPDRGVATKDGWGDSVLQSVDDALKQFGQVSGSLAQVVSEAKVDVFRIPNFMHLIGTADGEAQVLRRFTLANLTKSTANAIVLDKEEEWERIKAEFTGLPEVVQVYMLIASGAADIPVTRLVGQSPAGMNATGESDLRNYYDRVSGDQEDVLTPAMDYLDQAIERSALGKASPEIWYAWNPLWQMSDKERAEVDKLQAEAHKIDAEIGIIPSEVLREARLNQVTESGFYPGIEAILKDYEAGDLDPVEEADPEAMAAFAAANQNAQPGGTAEPGVGGAQPAARPQPAKKAATGDALAIADARPRTLYVRRDVLNAAEIRRWAVGAGLTNLVPAADMHVTIIHTRTPVDWLKISEPWGQDEKGRVVVPEGGPRMLEMLGVKQDALVLLFGSSRLGWRFEEIVRTTEARVDYPEYQPHITLAFLDAPISPDVLDKIVPYRGEIVLGPEIFEEVDDNWKAKVVAKVAEAVDAAE